MVAKAFLIAYFILLPESLMGQVLVDSDIARENFFFRVKNIEFFIDRFNNLKEDQIAAINPSDTLSYLHFLRQRDETILSLFDHDKLNKKNQEVRKKIEGFLRNINNPHNPRFIHFADSGWYAELTFAGKLDYKPITIQSILSVKPTKGGGLGWTMMAMKIPAKTQFELLPRQLVVFNPAVHGTDFLEVRLKLQDVNWVQSLIQKSKELQILNLIHSGNLEMGNIQKITYHFLQVPGWIFTVQYINRESKNSGWLFDELIPASPIEKADYQKRNLVN